MVVQTGHRSTVSVLSGKGKTLPGGEGQSVRNSPGTGTPGRGGGGPSRDSPVAMEGPGGTSLQPMGAWKENPVVLTDSRSKYFVLPNPCGCWRSSLLSVSSCYTVDCVECLVGREAFLNIICSLSRLMDNNVVTYRQDR